MEDLRTKYVKLLDIMREGYKTDEGKELTFCTEEFTGRITGLMCLFLTEGVIGKDSFDTYLGADWEWEHYSKVLAELRNFGIANADGTVCWNECHQIKIEMESIQDEEYYV